MSNIVRILLVCLILSQINTITIRSHEETKTETTTTPKATTDTKSGTSGSTTSSSTATASATSDLSTDQKKELDDWKANLIPWTKVGGKDMSKQFNDKLNKVFINTRAKMIKAGKTHPNKGNKGKSSTTPAAQKSD